METWKPIPGFDGYEASDQGNVRSYRKKGGGRHEATHLLKPSICSRYYGVNLRRRGVTYRRKNAVLVMRTFVGPRPDGMDVCHSNNNCLDDRLENLRYDTRIGNLRDRCPLTDRQIIEMRLRRASGENIPRLAVEYGISKEWTGNICRGVSLTRVSGPRTRGMHVNKLTLRQVDEIRERREGGEALLSIARDHDVSESAISLIARRLRHAGT